ncbi:MAG: Mrp/NBP35 family ATP-binding protein [Eubacteriales bacterium]|nr:Mrp/NBP35 family ATP-binding protein [Eubacteriales bacterium]
MTSCESCPSKSSCPSVGQDTCPPEQNQNARQNQAPSLEALHDLAQVRSVIGVCSGKGGVGKSLVTSLLAHELAQQGLTVGILDADITGPSIPRIFGLSGRLSGTENGIFPAQSHQGIQIVSINLMLDNPESPVLWRGPIISGIVKQFWTDVIWDTLDVLLIDLPPGTGDVPLTVFQSIPLDGIFVVSTPQDLVSMIVKKAENMATMMGVRIFGLIENMSYISCPDCDHEIKLFGEGQTAAAAAKMNIPLFARIPVDPVIAGLCDAGALENYDVERLPEATRFIHELLSTKP